MLGMNRKQTNSMFFKMLMVCIFFSVPMIMTLTYAYRLDCVSNPDPWKPACYKAQEQGFLYPLLFLIVLIPIVIGYGKTLPPKVVNDRRTES